jgi:hypothetical protein
MTRMDRAWPKFRAVALLTFGSIIVHELRYVVAYGEDARAALAEQGHSYMPFVQSLAVVLLAVVLARFCVSLLRARSGVLAEEHPPPFARLWLASSASLAGVYTLQEGFEGQFAPGHPGGLIGVFGHGGWTALIFSLLIGAAIAALTRLAHHALELVAAGAAPSSLGRSAPPPAPRAWAPRARRVDVLAWHLAGRAPPA